MDERVCVTCKISKPINKFAQSNGFIRKECFKCRSQKYNKWHKEDKKPTVKVISIKYQKIDNIISVLTEMFEIKLIEKPERDKLMGNVEGYLRSQTMKEGHSEELDMLKSKVFRILK